MELTVKYISQYKELIIKGNNVEFRTELLNEKESKRLAAQLIEVAQELNNE